MSIESNLVELQRRHRALEAEIAEANAHRSIDNLQMPRGRVPRRAADRGKSIPNALHSEWPHTDPAGRNVGTRQLA